MEKRVHMLQEIRYQEDRNTQAQLLQSPQIISFLKIKYEKELETERSKGNILDRLSKDLIELNRVITPQLYELFEEVCATLEVSIPITIFIHEKPLVNGSIFRVGRVSEDDEKRYIMIITTAALEKLEGEELKFLMGHELAHIMYQHDDLEHLQGLLANSDEDEEKEEKVGLPPLVERAYRKWKMNREISCDRVGMIACHNVSTAIRALMKISSGLQSTYLTTSVQDIVAYMENLCNKQMDIMEDFRTHPQYPARIIAMRDFGLYMEGMYTTEELDQKVTHMFRTMSRYPQREVDRAVMKLLAIGGMSIFLHKGSVTEKEMNMLVEALYKNFTDYPEEEIRMALHDNAYITFAEANDILCNENIKQKCTYLVAMFCRLALGDGNIDEEEKSFIFQEAHLLGIDEQIVFNCIVMLSEKEGLMVDNEVKALLEEVGEYTEGKNLQCLLGYEDTEKKRRNVSW